jgi:hypothetical protein
VVHTHAAVDYIGRLERQQGICSPSGQDSSRKKVRMSINPLSWELRPFDHAPCEGSARESPEGSLGEVVQRRLPAMLPRT